MQPDCPSKFINLSNFVPISCILQVLYLVNVNLTWTIMENTADTKPASNYNIILNSIIKDY